jgi:uncharacterized membrane protein (DUF485 family)
VGVVDAYAGESVMRVLAGASVVIVLMLLALVLAGAYVRFAGGQLDDRPDPEDP